MLVSVPDWETLATRVSVAVKPFRRAFTDHRPVELSYKPSLGVAETRVSPAGSRSFTLTCPEPSGPSFFSVTVKVTVWPL